VRQAQASMTTMEVKSAADLVPVHVVNATVLWCVVSEELMPLEKELAKAIKTTTNVASVSAVPFSVRGEQSVHNLFLILSKAGNFSIALRSVQAAVFTFLETADVISHDIKFDRKGLNAQGLTKAQVVAEHVPIGKLPDIKLPDEPRDLCGKYVKKVKGRKPKSQAAAAASGGKAVQRRRSIEADDANGSASSSSDDEAPRKRRASGSILLEQRRGAQKRRVLDSDEEEAGSILLEQRRGAQKRRVLDSKEEEEVTELGGDYNRAHDAAADCEGEGKGEGGVAVPAATADADNSVGAAAANGISQELASNQVSNAIAG
jgi:hypothetical protein